MFQIMIFQHFEGMRLNMNTAQRINLLSDFCGKRDLPSLTRDALNAAYGFEQADVFVLFGGSILAGGVVLADAMKHQVAKKYIIVGGEGHTTETLRQKMHQAFPFLMTEGLPEAEVFNRYLMAVHGLKADYLETKSTNCGNNITFLLELLHKNHIPCKSIILTQDASMQYRMYAVLQKYASKDLKIINYAAYQAHVREENGVLSYCETIWGMWEIKRYLSLLMGEIPRLTDDENGYGPKGKNFLVHLDIPEEVKTAFVELKSIYTNCIRPADMQYASPLS